MIEFLVDRKRTALAILVVLICAGIFGRINIPIENEPEITIPVVYVGASLTGISPQDSEPVSYTHLTLPTILLV